MSDIYSIREQKDKLFTSEHSPLSPAQRERFSGLEYFRIDQRFVVRANLTVFESQRVVTLETSKGGQKHFYRHGWAKMELNNKKECLTLYLPVEAPESTNYFVPFLDSTNGQQSYLHGRYLDLSLDSAGQIFIDFNLAYNPYCAYNSRWDCVQPPVENTIEQPVRAGERVYPDLEY